MTGSRITLRSHQKQAVESNVLFFKKRGYRSLLNFCATGAGKTCIAIKTNEALFDPVDKRTLFLVDQREIVRQTQRAYHKFWPELNKSTWTRHGFPGIGMVMGEYDERMGRVIVATPQTLAEGDRLERVLEYGKFDFIIHDEAHTSITQRVIELQKKLLDINRDIKTMGLTATPLRWDGKALGLLFEHINVKYDLAWCIKNGILCPVLDPLEIQTNIDVPDFASGKTVEEKASKALDVDNWNEILYEAWQEHAQDRQGVVWFMPSVEHSRAFCRFMQGKGIRIAHVESDLCIDFNGSEVTEKKRADILSQYDEYGGHLTNFRVLLCGWDAPHTDCIGWAKPTENVVDMTQGIGRGTRLFAGSKHLKPKENLLILDFALKGLSIVTVGTLLGSDLEAARLPAEAETEQLSEGVSTLETEDGADLTITGKGILTRTGSLFKKRKEAWYEDYDNFRSLGCSESDILLVRPPDYVKAGRLRRPLNVIGAPEIEMAFEMYANYTLWHLHKEGTGWMAPATWESCEQTVDLLFDFIAPLQEELFDPALARKNRDWRRSAAPATEKQAQFLRGLLSQLERADIPIHFQPPSTKGECAQIITHAQALLKLTPVFRQIMRSANETIRRYRKAS